MTVIELRIRPRWKRILLAPRLIMQHRRTGLPFFLALRLAWMVVRL